MKRSIILLAVISGFVFGCCCQKNCVKDERQAEKSKIEAKKALDEMDKEKNKENDQ